MSFHILKWCVFWCLLWLALRMGFGPHFGILSMQQKLKTIQVYSLNHSTQPGRDQRKSRKKERWKSTQMVNCALQALRRDHLNMQNLPVLSFKDVCKGGFAVFLHQGTSGMTSPVDLWQVSSLSDLQPRGSGEGKRACCSSWDFTEHLLFDPACTLSNVPSAFCPLSVSLILFFSSAFAQWLYLAFLLLFSHPFPFSFTFSPICHIFLSFRYPPSILYLLLLSVPLCSNQLEITVQFTEKQGRWKESVWLPDCLRF